MEKRLSRCGEIAYEKDRDRFLTVMTAPEAVRDNLFSLLAFNHEIAKTRDSVSEIMLGQIRLQWWREAIAECYGKEEVRRHEVVQPLSQTIRQHDLSEEIFLRLIDERERDIAEQEFGNIEDLAGYAANTGGLLTELMVEVLGATSETDRQIALDLGTAWALVGIVRSLPFSLRQKRIMIPSELIRRHQINRQDLLELRNPESLKPALCDICDLARGLIVKARTKTNQSDKNALPAFHIAGFADSYLRQLEKAGYDTFSPSLARPATFRNLGLISRHLLRKF